MIVLVDTKEKSNKHITDYFESKGIKYKKMAFETADYSVMLPANSDYGIHRDLYFNDIFAIERKGSLVELSGNFTKERHRIAAEFSRAKADITLLIESNGIEDILTHNYETQYAPASYIATLLSFETRYNLKTKFISKKYAGLIIYQILYYKLREFLMRGE